MSFWSFQHVLTLTSEILLCVRGPVHCILDKGVSNTGNFTICKFTKIYKNLKKPIFPHSWHVKHLNLSKCAMHLIEPKQDVYYITATLVCLFAVAHPPVCNVPRRFRGLCAVSRRPSPACNAAATPPPRPPPEPWCNMSLPSVTCPPDSGPQTPAALGWTGATLSVVKINPKFKQRNTYIFIYEMVSIYRRMSNLSQFFLLFSVPLNK